MIQYNSKVCMDRYATIAKAIGLPGNTDKQLVNALVDSIRELNRRLNIAPTYKENGVSEEKFKEKLDFIAENAVGDPCTGSNPRDVYKRQAMGVVKNLLTNCILINIGLGTFNLIPFPPLDGSKVLMAVLPEKAYFSYMRYERYGQFVLFLLLRLGVLDKPLSFARNLSLIHI